MWGKVGSIWVINLDLNCNVHPLDGLSVASKRRCKEYERENQAHGVSVGRDFALLKVIVTITTCGTVMAKGILLV